MVRTAYVVLALIAIVPIWSVHYLPTGDGPCHLYNASILHDLVTGAAAPPISTWYRIDWHPYPNWVGHAVLALLLFVVPPLVAEKILVTAVVLTFFAGAWILTGAVDERTRAYAFIAFPFAYSSLLHAGFYNFVLSAGLFLIVLGVWWERRDDPSARTIAIVAALLVLCYFSHPMGTALAIASIGWLWIATLRGRPFRVHVRHLVALLPALVLLGWFMTSHAEAAETKKWPMRVLAAYLARTQVLFTFDRYALTAGKWIAAALLVLIIATAICHRFPRRLREADAFFVLFLAFVALYFFAPAGFAGGELVTERMALFVVLIVLPWLSPELPLSVRRAVMIAFALLALVNTAYLVDRYRIADRRIATFLATTAAIPPDSVVLPLLGQHVWPGKVTNMITHAIDYAALEKHFVDLDNYEPGTNYFPIAWAAGVEEPDAIEIEVSPADLDFASYAKTADVVFTWRMRPSVAEDIQDFYQLAGDSGQARVYIREEQALLLLPIAGRSDGSVDQTIRNDSRERVRVVMNDHIVDLPPGAAPKIAADGEPYVLLRVPRRAAQSIVVSTVLRRTGKTIPAVRDFRRSTITIPNVPLDAPAALRVWTFGTERPAGFTLRIGSAAPRSVRTGPDGFAIVPLPANGGRAEIVITADDPDAKLWACATSGDPPASFYPP